MGSPEMQVALSKIRPHISPNLTHQKKPAQLLVALESTVQSAPRISARLQLPRPLPTLQHSLQPFKALSPSTRRPSTAPMSSQQRSTSLPLSSHSSLLLSSDPGPPLSSPFSYPFSRVHVLTRLPLSQFLAFSSPPSIPIPSTPRLFATHSAPLSNISSTPAAKFVPRRRRSSVISCQILHPRCRRIHGEFVLASGHARCPRRRRPSHLASLKRAGTS